jgi:hypothetical protein
MPRRTRQRGGSSAVDREIQLAMRALRAALGDARGARRLADRAVRSAVLRASRFWCGAARDAPGARARRGRGGHVMQAPGREMLGLAIERLHERALLVDRMLHPLVALDAAIDRLRAAVTDERGDGAGVRELAEVAAHDVMRAVVQARRWIRELEHAAIVALDEAAYHVGVERLRLGHTGQVG